MSYPTGVVINYQYDGVGRIASITSSQGAWSTIADSFLYQPVSGQRYAWRFGNNKPRKVTLMPMGALLRYMEAVSMSTLNTVPSTI